MADTTPPTAPTPPEARGFPFVTVTGAVAVLFLFVWLVARIYREPNPLGEPRTEQKAEPRADPAAKLNEVRAKNQAVLDGNPGTGVKMSVGEATARLLGSLKTEKDTLPFPTPEPAGPPTPEPKPKQ